MIHSKNQFGEELWDVHDKETLKMIEEGRKNPESGVDFFKWVTEFGVKQD